MRELLENGFLVKVKQDVSFVSVITEERLVAGRLRLFGYDLCNVPIMLFVNGYGVIFYND